MTRYERFVLWLNRFYHKQNKITICVLYTLIMAILGVLIYGATHQQASSSISVKYTVPSYTVTFDPNGGELSTIGGGVSSKIVKLGDTYGDLPVPTRTGYAFVGWRGRNLIDINRGYRASSLLSFNIEGDKMTLTNEANTTGKKEYSCVIIPIEDLTDGRYWLSYEDVNYSGECNEPSISIYGKVSQGNVSTGMRVFYNTNESTAAYFDFSTLNSQYNEYYISGEYHIEIYVSVGSSFEAGSLSFSNLMLTKVSSENEVVKYEPYYIESDTVFGTPGDRTLTAMWSQDNILTGGALQTESDLAQWQQLSEHDGTEGGFTDGVASIVTEDNYSCAKIEGQQHRAKQIHQSVLGKFEAKKMYSITAKVKLVNMIKHENTATSSYFNPVIMLYSTGYVGSTWFRPINNCYISDYNNQGWVDVRFVGLSCPEVADDFDISQATSISFAVFIANYSGTLYIRDFAIAKM